MLRALRLVLFVSGALLHAVGPCTAQDFKGFSSAEICTNPAGDGLIKFAAVLQASIATAGCRVIDDSGEIVSRDALIVCAAGSDSLKAFLKDYPKSRYAITLRGETTNSLIDSGDFLRNFKNYEARCIAAENAIAFERASSDFDAQTKKIGDYVRVRKAAADLAKSLEVADPAFVSFTDDQIAGNKAASYAVTVGTIFEFGSDDIGSNDPFAATHGYLFPYVRLAGEENSLNSKADLENWAAGIRVDYLNVPVAGEFLKTDVGGFFEYLTDSEAESEVLSSEAGIRPRFNDTIPLLNFINRKKVSFGYFGPWIFTELTGKMRYGHVSDPGGKPGLLLTSEYSRAGFTAAARTGYAGSGPLSGFELAGSFTKFDTFEGQGGAFEYFTAELTYNFTKNIGLKFDRKKGTEPDKLDVLDRYTAGLTFRF